MVVVNREFRKPKRILGTYYRVQFYGRPFEDLDGQEYIYKEPQITQLSEIALRLENIFKQRFGKVNMIRDAGRVDVSKLDLNTAHFQVTHVEPYFPDSEKAHRRTNFERNHGVSSFVYEVLLGKPGGVADRQVERVILTVEEGLTFPYIKKRYEM